MTTDLDMLARHLINVWGDFVKVDDIPDELIVPFAVDTLRHAAAALAALRAENEALKDRATKLEEVVNEFRSHLERCDCGGNCDAAQLMLWQIFEKIDHEKG